MVEYYEYETSPRKLAPKYVHKRKPQQKQHSEEKLKAHTDTYKEKQKQKAIEVRKNARIIRDIIIGFIVLLVISYRYALINTKLSEKETLKSELAAIQKQNAQLKVSIEQGMNINNIEQAAKEKLGMQKLDNNQKVYVSLDKKDYTESVTENTSESEKTWFQKLISKLTGE